MGFSSGSGGPSWLIDDRVESVLGVGESGRWLELMDKIFLNPWRDGLNSPV